MTDLGTLGGSHSGARAINDRGQVVGWSDTADGAMHAVLWEGGTLTELGTLVGDTILAYAVNARRQAVGVSETARGEWHAALWE